MNISRKLLYAPMGKLPKTFLNWLLNIDKKFSYRYAAENKLEISRDRTEQGRQAKVFS